MSGLNIPKACSMVLSMLSERLFRVSAYCPGASCSGNSCGGKYKSCTCADGYEWKDGSCQKQVLNGAKGKLYYCNGTVVGVKASSMDFYIAMKDLGSMNWTSANSSCQSYSFCGNIKGTLPTKDKLKTIYNNKSLINSLLSSNSGTQLTNSYYWLSTNGSVNTSYYVVHMYGGIVGDYYYGSNYYVRPVLTSW